MDFEIEINLDRRLVGGLLPLGERRDQLPQLLLLDEDQVPRVTERLRHLVPIAPQKFKMGNAS